MALLAWDPGAWGKGRAEALTAAEQAVPAVDPVEEWLGADSAEAAERVAAVVLEAEAALLAGGHAAPACPISPT